MVLNKRQPSTCRWELPRTLIQIAHVLSMCSNRRGQTWAHLHTASLLLRALAKPIPGQKGKPFATKPCIVFKTDRTPNTTNLWPTMRTTMNTTMTKYEDKHYDSNCPFLTPQPPAAGGPATCCVVINQSKQQHNGHPPPHHHRRRHCRCHRHHCQCHHHHTPLIN